MNAKELIEILEKLDPDTQVILQSDAEGNNFMQLHSHWTGVYNEDTGDYGYSELTPQLLEEGYSQEDIIEDGKPAIFLWG